MGQYIERIRKAGKLKQLENTIEQDALLNKPEHRQCVPGRQAGRKVRYPLGSVVEFENYVLTAFTKFDEDNKAYLSAEEYVGFWMQFWNPDIREFRFMKKLWTILSEFFMPKM